MGHEPALQERSRDEDAVTVRSVDLDSIPPLGPTRCVASVAAQVGMEEGRVSRKLQD
jgi:hypothetical protein